jgi:hypothetical protein
MEARPMQTRTEELTAIAVLTQPPAAVTVLLACDPYDEVLARHTGLAAPPHLPRFRCVACFLPDRGCMS